MDRREKKNDEIEGLDSGRSFADKIMESPFFEKVMERKKEAGFAALVVLALVIWIFYSVSHREEEKLKTISQAAQYAKQLVNPEKSYPEETEFDLKARRLRYESALQGLERLVNGSKEIEERFGGILAEALLLENEALEDRALAGEVIGQLRKTGLNAYADFSQLSVYIHQKQFEEARALLHSLKVEIRGKQSRQYGPLYAFCLLQEAAIAKETGDASLAEKVGNELKEMLVQKGSEAMISEEDADQILKILRDKNSSLLEFLLAKGDK